MHHVIKGREILDGAALKISLPFTSGCMSRSKLTQPCLRQGKMYTMSCTLQSPRSSARRLADAAPAEVKGTPYSKINLGVPAGGWSPATAPVFTTPATLVY